MSERTDGLATLHPAYFAMVMATGIISVAAQLLDMPRLATGLLWLNGLVYAILWLLTLARIVLRRAQFAADLVDHNRSVGFFTIVAATCVVGNQLVIVARSPQLAVVFWYAGIALWAVLTYSLFTILTVKARKPSLAEGINGGWLTAVVAAQAVSALGSLVAGQFDQARQVVLFFSLVMWLGGGMLYLWIISLIFYRYTFFPLGPADLTPPYWINMGAMAISTLAGSLLIDNARRWSLLEELLPFLKGGTLLFWSTATWWVPILLILGVWRHVYSRFPLRYDPVYWSAVFPLGMYTVCTIRLSQVVDAPFLMVIPRIAMYVALAAWTAAFTGLLLQLVVRPGTAARGSERR